MREIYILQLFASFKSSVDFSKKSFLPREGELRELVFGRGEFGDLGLGNKRYRGRRSEKRDYGRVPVRACPYEVEEDSFRCGVEHGG
jgi:hypothetical protein